jgi:hypothetical protein
LTKHASPKSAEACDHANDYRPSLAGFGLRPSLAAKRRPGRRENESHSALGDPSWRSKQSSATLAIDDKTLKPDLERDMAKCAGSSSVEIIASLQNWTSTPLSRFAMSCEWRSNPIIKQKSKRNLARLTYLQREQLVSTGSTKIDRGYWLSSSDSHLDESKARIDHE